MPKLLPDSKKTGEPSWMWRRILVYTTVAICFWLIFRLIDSPDTRVNDTIAWSLCMIIVLLVMTYTGAATVQDIVAIWQMRSARPYAENPEPVEAEPKEPVTVVSEKTTVTGGPVTNVASTTKAKPKPEPDPPDGGD